MQELAIFGGQPTVPAGMIKSWPPISQEDRDAVMAVFDSNIFHGTGAPNAVALQQEFADYLGVKYCLVTNSGTSALHMAVAALGIGPGDEVIVPAFTYWSTAAAVLHHNAIPVFVDIEDDAFCIDVRKIEAAITPKTKAILPVHIHGMPAAMNNIMPLAKKHNLLVIGDACQAHGAAVNGKKVGTFEDTCGFSTNRSKNLSSGEGGFFVTNNEDAYRVAVKLREFGEVVVHGQTREYNAFGLGWMYRQHEFVNAFCRSQLKHLPENNARRKEFAEYLTAELAKIPGFKGPYTPPGREPVYFSYIVRFCPEELGIDATMAEYKAATQKILAAENIRLGQWQTRPVPGQSVFQAMEGYGKGCPWTCAHYGRKIRYDENDYPVTIKFIAEHAYLAAVYPPNTMELMKKYVEGFKKVSSQPDKIRKVIEDARKA
ncbi:MAG TPA: DegT/DnrJ/EryC1/StrS family aminotransferase [Lentisphaeria bacterium]|nr:DegT/DnrJ/EryC1/StrS family aminotransferase [Lentisphaerota bacterium]OQC13592.1 MAG: L-glutamine:2-deoxy-scyllo-inosose aminotransferase [Lentisphaerae bacterium ADurb.Bin082]HQC51675.1 DegT/DnrJ/EryC1/StrS family aminotransferase [Lentisphaeria bacterium]HQL87368.1 DegT/DnrJ/EryC1/StrS family aminotransferase [Lentisphaeria bacterium]